MSDLGMWVVRLVAEVRRLRVARPTSTGEEREVLTRLVHDETGEAEEESGFVADAILAAFDVRLKAHTSTDDEREAPTQELCDRCGWASSGHVRSQYGLDCPPGGSRPGFRRSEVPEPVTPPRAGSRPGTTMTDATPHPDPAGGESLEPPGEPSDAQVEIAWRTYEGISPKTFVMGPAIGKARERMRAALRAAGGVR